MPKKGKEKKTAIETPDNQNTEVIIYIGLAAWNSKCDSLKKMHGKRLALRVNKKDPPATLVEKALTKWKAYKSDCCCEDEECLLLNGDDVENAVVIEDSVFEKPGTSEQLPRQESNAKDYEESSSAQIRTDHDMALALHNSINNYDDDDEALCVVVPAPRDAVTDPASVVKVLQKKVIEDCHLFLTTRRIISLNRVVQLWQRERKKKPAEYKVCIKYLGAEGIDTGALSREFFADAINDIAKVMFPNGSAVHSTLFI